MLVDFDYKLEDSEFLVKNIPDNLESFNFELLDCNDKLLINDNQKLNGAENTEEKEDKKKKHNQGIKFMKQKSRSSF